MKIASLNQKTIPLIIAILIISIRASFADGFILSRSLENEPHVHLKLSPEQIKSVGKSRKLILDKGQKITLEDIAGHSFSVLGIESIYEPDCSCHISSAMWTAADEVTIWTERIKRDKTGSKYYYTCRNGKNHFTMDSNGIIYRKGRAVSIVSFEKHLKYLSNHHPQYRAHLSTPPVIPPEIETKIEALKAHYHFGYKL